MASSSCRAVCAVFLCLFSLACLLVAILPLTLGSWIICKDKTRGITGLDSYSSSMFITGFALVLIGLGLTLVLAGVSGLYGASSRKKGALETFGGFAFLLATAGVLFGVLALFIKERVGLYILRVYVELYSLYVADGQDAVLMVVLRTIHEMFHCCGVTGIALMEGACPRPRQFLERIVMPSCPLTIALHFDRKSPFLLFFFGITASLWILPMCCCSILSKKQSPTDPSPQYIPLLNPALPSTPAPALAPPPALPLAPPPALPLAPPPAYSPPYAQAYVAPPWSFPEQEPASVDSLSVADASALKGLA